MSELDYVAGFIEGYAAAIDEAKQLLGLADAVQAQRCAQRGDRRLKRLRALLRLAGR